MPKEPNHESERRTREQRIDPKLQAAGWTITPYVDGTNLSRYSSHAVTEFPTANGPADYALFVAGKLIGVVEAKKVTLGPQGVLTQAERYARGIADSPYNFRGLRVPFLFSTNGEVIHFHDVRHKLNLSRPISRFFTPAALAELLARDEQAAIDSLLAAPNIVRGFHPYQVEANSAVEHAIREHLVINLAVDQSDFDELPVFSRAGGWSAADRTFNGMLCKLLNVLNEAIAA